MCNITSFFLLNWNQPLNFVFSYSYPLLWHSSWPWWPWWVSLQRCPLLSLLHSLTVTISSPRSRSTTTATDTETFLAKGSWPTITWASLHYTSCIVHWSCGCGFDETQQSTPVQQHSSLDTWQKARHPGRLTGAMPLAASAADYLLALTEGDHVAWPFISLSSR